LAAGVPRAFDSFDFSVVLLGYAVMRVALVTQWLRAARSDVERRPTNLRYAAGVGACLLAWALLLVVPGAWRLPMFAVLVVAELLVPVWAERPSATTWHPRHIAERFGLFTLIVLGESVLAATTAIQSVLGSPAAGPELAAVGAGGL